MAFSQWAPSLDNRVMASPHADMTIFGYRDGYSVDAEAPGTVIAPAGNVRAYGARNTFAVKGVRK
jgi:hypothetical protein